jgi:hypothetical protein
MTIHFGERRTLANGEIWQRYHDGRWHMPYVPMAEYCPISAAVFPEYAWSIAVQFARTGRLALADRLRAVRSSATYYAWPWSAGPGTVWRH